MASNNNNNPNPNVMDEEDNQVSFGSDPLNPSLHHPLMRARVLLAHFFIQRVQQAYEKLNSNNADLNLNNMANDLVTKIMTKPTKTENGDLSIPVFQFVKKFGSLTPGGGKPDNVAKFMAEALKENPPSAIKSITSEGPYINIFLSASYLASSVIPNILNGKYLKALPSTKPRVMIEYSQPNTHKAFHVGHMRNAALGDSLVRLYKQMGYPVKAANYFGDEGAHVAKCLWFLNRFLAKNPGFQLESVPVHERGEWLGKMYSSAVEELSLSNYTVFPYPDVIIGKVISKEPHPHSEAPKNWNVVKLDINAANGPVTVICGGVGYDVNDFVAYIPLGGKMNKKDGKGQVEVVPKDMKGIISNGIILSRKELGIEPDVLDQKPNSNNNNNNSNSNTTSNEKKPNAKGKGGSAGAQPVEVVDPIFVVPLEKIFNKNYLFPGNSLVEAGRIPDKIPEETKVIDYLDVFKKESKEVLQKLEHGDEKMCALWKYTGDWSLNEFRKIYEWLGVSFDVEFFESQVSAPSLAMVRKWHNEKRPYIKEDKGSVGCDLSEFGLGYCMLLKSNGSGLYATKDMALAERKFNEFKIDVSLYIVDAAQTLHFKQVFKTLELMGYEQAKKCVHLPYGQVVLPSGKMSSRTGSVIFFSQLKNLLNEDIYKNFLIKYTPEGAKEAEEEIKLKIAKGETVQTTTKKSEIWPLEEIAQAQHKISVATIKYGMLSHDVAKDIVFVLEEWTAKSGNTGPYMLYAYARIRSIGRELPESIRDEQVDYSLLTHPTERNALLILMEFWTVINTVVERNNPATLCEYLFDLAKSFSSFYEQVSIKGETNLVLQATRLHFINSIALTLAKGLDLLGIQTLDRM